MFRNYGYPKSEPENTTTEEGEFGENSYAAIFGRSKIECKPYKGPMPNKTIPAGLRHLKMELKSLIVAKQSCTGQEIEDSYCSLFGYRPQYREFGYKGIDELLAAFPDICKGYIDPSGSKIYIPVVDERHKDLAFQLSRAPRSPSKREHRHPCTNGPDRTSPNRQNIPPISDFRFRQPWLKNRVASTKSIGQFPLPPVPASERLIFKDDGAKCPERCRAITDMVRNIGEKSPDRTETRCHIETLKNHYYHLTGLSLWGKIMHVSDYAEAMDKPDFYKFWRIMNEPSTDGGRAHYMVVPTDPKNNYLYLYQCDTSNTSEEALEGLPEAYGIEGEPDKKA